VVRYTTFSEGAPGRASAQNDRAFFGHFIPKSVRANIEQCQELVVLPIEVSKDRPWDRPRSAGPLHYVSTATIAPDRLASNGGAHSSFDAASRAAGIAHDGAAEMRDLCGSA
jgi:hypothetical protein